MRLYVLEDVLASALQGKCNAPHNFTLAQVLKSQIDAARDKSLGEPGRMHGRFRAT